ncbi:probable RNA-binding protein EIF1AD [Watersipora subatra]|uniref:probable RNA-binding protein EIF1AD n=1 Tax=Watersipora subatra TaxID=2589382 RepID=UPI00355AF267
MTSKATKRKHVIKEVLDDFVLPEGDQEVVQVLSSCGNNLHQVMNDNGQNYLVSMPTKFRRNVWIKRGNYVIVTPIEEGDKVKAEITTILYKEQIKYIKDCGQWPESFSNDKTKEKTSAAIDEDLLPPTYSDSDSEEEMLFGSGNPNRPNLVAKETSSDSDSES